MNEKPVFEPHEAVIRVATLEDLADIFVVEREGYEFPWSEQVIADCFKPNYFVFVIEIQHHIVGYAIVTDIVGEAHLLNICIGLAYRCKGLARKLLVFIICFCREKKLESILLEVRVSNEQAIYLYQSLDFSEIGRRKNYYPSSSGREDALMFLLPIQTPAIDYLV